MDDVNNKRTQTGNELGGNNKKNISGAKKKKVEKLAHDSNLLGTYKGRLQLLIKSDSVKVGSGVQQNSMVRKYKQPKQQAYKITGGSYGKLNINMPLLLNEMLLQVLKDGQIVYEDKADKSLVDLLTKRFNPNKKYSNKAIQIFNNLNMLAQMSSHRSSKKETLVGSSIFTNADDMMKRLTLLTGSHKAGNNNLRLRNEVWQIIDALLKLGKITKTQHDQYVQKHLI